MDFFHKDKRIGTLKEGVFRKRVQKSKHLMRLMDGWGIQNDALTTLKAHGCTEIRILETEEDTVYSVPFDTIYKQGQVHDFGDGMQVFLPRSQWKITKRKNGKTK